MHGIPRLPVSSRQSRAKGAKDGQDLTAWTHYLAGNRSTLTNSSGAMGLGRYPALSNGAK